MNIGILHPSQFDLGKPFDYVPASGSFALYTETLNGGSGSGGVSAQATGVRLTPRGPGSVEDTSCVVQRVQGKAIAEGTRVLMAGRIAMSGASGGKLMFGFWATDSEPFGAVENGVFFFKDAGSGSVVGRSKTSSGTDTPTLFTLSADTFVDVAVILHGTCDLANDRFVEWLWVEEHGVWQSVVQDEGDTNIPTVAMRPSFAVRRPNASASTMDVASLALAVQR